MQDSKANELVPQFLHPAAFGPITEAPRSMVKKLQLAPL